MKWFINLVFGFLLSSFLGLAGCASGGGAKNLTFEQQQTQMKNTLAALEAANFVGELELDHAGTPLKVGIKQEAYLGSDSSKLRVFGKIDFTKPPRAAVSQIP